MTTEVDSLQSLCTKKIAGLVALHSECGAAPGIIEALEFIPDAVSMAKSLGGGFPIGAFWVRAEHADLLHHGKHGTTFGGNPLGCAVGNAIFEVIASEGLERRLVLFLLASLPSVPPGASSRISRTAAARHASPSS